MNKELRTDDIRQIIEQANRARSAAAGELIAKSLRASLACLLQASIRLLKGVDDFLHVFLMSPTVPR